MKKIEKPNKRASYERLKKVIVSCKTKDQLMVARDMVQNWIKMFFKDDIVQHTGNLQALLTLRHRIIDASSEKTE